MNANQFAASALLVLAVQVVAQAAGSQSAQGEAAAAPQASLTDVLKQQAEADLSVPASPAFALLGLTPTGIQRPGTVRELATAIAKGFDKDGKPKTGLAIDFAPLPLLAEHLVVGGDRYKNDPLNQMLTRTTVSLATADANGASQLAWGIRVGVFDQGDPGLYANELAACIRKSKVFPGAPPPGPSLAAPTAATTAATTAAAAAATNQAVAACDQAPKLALWAKPALYLGFGQSWYSASGALKDNTPAVKALWATYSVGRELVTLRGLLQLHAERKTDDRVADPSDATKLLRQDTTSMVARLRLGAEKWHGFVDVGRNRVNLAATTAASTRYSGLGAELRLRDDLWLQVGRSAESGLKDGSTQNRVTAGIRFGSEPYLMTPGAAK